MLIRVRPDLYVNSDHIIAIFFFSAGASMPFTVINTRSLPIVPGTLNPPLTPCGIILCANGSAFHVSEEAARYALEILEANTAAILPEDEDSEPGKPTLKTQIAQALRDTWKGVTLGQLDAVFPDAGIPAVKAALAKLEVERTVVGIERLDVIGIARPNSPVILYYHASSSEAQAYARSATRNPQSEILPLTPSLDLSTAAAAQPDALHQVEEHTES